MTAKPWRCASSTAAFSANSAVAMTCTWRGPSVRSCVTGGRRNTSSTAGETSIRWRCNTANASKGLLWSANVGPEATTAGSSPGTSDTTKVCTAAAPHACAKRPPLMRDRWRRTMFMSLMCAPQRSKATFTARSSVIDKPSAGKVMRDEPPPDTKASTKSSGPISRAMASICSAAIAPASSGTGWPDSTILMRSQRSPCP